MEKILQELKTRLIEIKAIESVVELLSWDQNVYMPLGGAATRAQQMAVLAQLAHEKFTDPVIGNLLEKLHAYQTSLPSDSDNAALIRVTQRLYDKAIRIPADFQAKLYTHFAQSYQVWTEVRPANDFAVVQPYLEKTLELSREYANFFPGYDHIADPLIDIEDQEMNVATIRILFAELREQLVPMIKAIAEQPVPDNACLYQRFPETPQLVFGLEVIKKFGFDFERGRRDLSPHPFSTEFAIGDVRITTRVKEYDLSDAFFSTLHEAGHALYAQGIQPEFEGTPLAKSASTGISESQARLWENIVGRSRGFWSYFYPQLQATFPDQLSPVPLDTFYRAINKVQPSLIRTDADEVTYNLHVIMRFDFELQLLEGKLAVRDLPEAWRERFKADFGIAPPDDRDGVLQDAHWFDGFIGGQFQGYTIGNILSAQFLDAVLKAHPEIPNQIENGQFDTLHNWLKENIYRHGCKYTPSELIARVTGTSLTIEPYIRYLRTKYSGLYQL